ncbi:MarR family transcriptional regulator [Hyphococcus sp.]|jgi:DNA-binding MarR family transcriptional regulator|uniref:MarR family transcriptional regulator n=1 Tax=Hyphococcus sp. TaxID=2038636 RepID=UPI003D0FC594
MDVLSENLFGLQMRRVSDLIGEQGREVFWRSGIALDAKLISLVIALYEQDEQSSSELAAFTGLSRQLVESRLKTLEAEAYVKSAVSREDARKRVFSLSRRKRAEIEEAVDMMRDFEAVYDALWREIGVDMSEAVLKLERALHAKPLLARLCQEFPQYQQDLKVSSHDR